ncbi:MAG: hypothetical protein ABI905_11575 [Betaproteobacteria bacterium]
MSAGDIYSKTPLGAQEMSNRKLKLTPRLRTMLILVDGHQPVLILQEEAGKLGAPADFLDQLLAMKLIEKTGGIATQESRAADAQAVQPPPALDEFSRFRAAKDFMNVTVVDALGIKSFFFTLKLERAGNVADLRELVGPYRDAITKGSGAEEARVFSERLAVLLK